VNIPYCGAKGSLHLLITSIGLQANHCRAVDSTGIKVEGEGEWNARKHGGPKRCVWRKIHIGIDKQTLEVRAVEITDSNTGDAPMLPYLFNQILRDQRIGSVIADGAYDSRRCHNAIAKRGAAAVITPRRNTHPWKPTTAGAIARNDALLASRYLGRALWRNWSG
jgi:transposase